MSLTRPLAVSALAAVTAVGDDADQTCTSVRANILRLREDPRYVTLADPGADLDDPAPARTARVDSIDPDLEGRERLLGLLEPVVSGLCERETHLRRDAHRAALLLSLPGPDPVSDGWRLEALSGELTTRLGLRFGSIKVVRTGHPGVLAQLAEAASLLAKGAAEVCLVAAVDSYLDRARLAFLDEAERLKSPRNIDGRFPGEAAAALVVESDRRVESRGGEVLVWVRGLGAGIEAETLASDKPSSGKGLSDAIRGALAGGAGPRWVIGDLNGESYRSYEWGLVQARLGERLQDLAAMSLPARNTGDIGAVTGAVAVALAAAGWKRGWAPGKVDEALVFSGSDGAERAAARLGRG